MSEKGQARAGKSARNRLVRALLQTAFDNLPGDGAAAPPPADKWGALTLSQAGERAGLSRPSVAAARDQLRPVLSETVGPHAAQRIALDPSQGVAFGVEFRLDQLSVYMADLYGQPIGDPKQESKGLEEDPRATLDRAAAMIDSCLADAGRGSEAVVGVGMSLAHPVDPRKVGAVRALSTSDDRGWQLWEGLGDVRQQLRQRLGWPELREPSLDRFIAENDANLSAFAESRWGAARDRQHALYVFWGDGIGSGLIVDGEVHRGVGGIAGAIGHMPLFDGPDAEKCPRCGLMGCLETVAAGKAILARAGIEDGPDAIDRLVAQATESRESPAGRALDEAAFHLGRALGICLHVLNPEAVVIGGSVGHRAFELVRNEGLERGLRKQAVPSARDDVNVGGIHRSRFAAHTAVRGATARVLWEFLPEYLDRRCGLGG
jgi:predicted NBD/HSP70 family sugar kinase